MDEFFLDQDSLNEGLLRLIEERIFIAGLNIYNSHFDKENAYEISDVGVRQFITLEAVTGGEEPSDGESQKPGVLTIYWCGFGSCKDSRDNDVNPQATHIFLAYLSIRDDGEVFLDGEVPMDLFEEWRNNDQKLIISVGGMDFDWSMVYDNQQQFVESLMQFLEQWQLSGVDLNIRSYDQPPERLLSLLEDIKGQLSNDQILILTVDSVTVIPGMEFPVHSLQQLQDGEEMMGKQKQ
ncbi:Glycoside hydrolase, superfamily [Pseudocohnilembus persalinus]|uniref:Glycoside hydrolase, superfamily n=1 Tax=Pseudocohnilembus persalinus TaxID=266149 RepID=A0A0V0QJZ7_PSEPJ|nr:Glycoside hydrolase, superfamily [Pseudocohnilembus persalinus]|eukprot:KRX02621.1 Glycoside hydrolase, superfamily [Pseudocohnilembus persalinus]